MRRDAYAVYACCRSVDDAVDGAAARGEVVRPEVAGEILGRAFGEGGVYCAGLSSGNWGASF